MNFEVTPQECLASDPAGHMVMETIGSLQKAGHDCKPIWDAVAARKSIDARIVIEGCEFPLREFAASMYALMDRAIQTAAVDLLQERAHAAAAALDTLTEEIKDSCRDLFPDACQNEDC